MYDDNGWYNFTPGRYTSGGLETWYHSMKDSDRSLFPGNSWVAFLDGKNPNYPASALRGDLERIRSRVAGSRADTTTPDTRLADDPMKFNPASVGSLIQLMLGGIHPGHRGQVLHARVRYFDPVARRAGDLMASPLNFEKTSGDFLRRSANASLWWCCPRRRLISNWPVRWSDCLGTRRRKYV